MAASIRGATIPRRRSHANYGKTGSHNYGALALVGTLEDGKSPYGIFDMAGNVREWVSDWYDNDYYKNSPKQNPTGPSKGGFKVIRGGSWNSNTRNLRLRGSVLGSAVVPELILSRVPVREDSVARGSWITWFLALRPKGVESPHSS